jgi:hypothetical protein
LNADTSATNATEFVIDLLLQIREFASANLDLLSTERTIKYDQKTTSRTRTASQRDKNGNLEAFLLT